MVQVNTWEEGTRVKELLIELIGHLWVPSFFSSYLRSIHRLSVAHRIRWWGNSWSLLLGQDRALQTNPISGYRIHMAVPVNPVAHAVISLWARFPHLFQFQVSP